MPWVSTIELPNPRRGKVNFAAKREYERTFKVQMSLPTDGSIQVSVAPGIPFMFSSYFDADGTYDLGAIAYDISAEQQEDMLWWLVSVKYASGERSRYSRFQPEKGDNRFSDPNPLNRPAQFIWGSNKYQRPIYCDEYSYAIQNEAGDYFDPPVTAPDDRVTLTVIQNEAGYDPQTSQDYEGAINNDSFLGQPPYCVRLTERSGRSNVENNLLYWEVTYQFEFRYWGLDARDKATWNLAGLVLPGNPNNGQPGYVQYTRELGWLDLRRNEGFYQIVKRNNVLFWTPILDSNSQKVITPKSLGLVQQDGTVSALLPGQQPYYLVFHVHKERAFSNLLTAG